MERRVFPQAQVQEAFREFVLIRLDTDRHREYEAMQIARFNTNTRPLYVVLGPDERTIATVGGSMSEADFVAFLKGALATWRANKP